jgi:hypothetical protein
MDITEQELADINRIIRGYFLKEFGSQQKADIAYRKLDALAQDPGVKLVHIGNTVFLVILVAPQVAEIHTMSLDEDSVSLAKNFVDLANFLRDIGIVEVYTYSDDPRFQVIARRTRLPIETSTFQSEDGKTYTIYSLRFA